jgi:hypothetical protein
VRSFLAPLHRRIERDVPQPRPLGGEFGLGFQGPLKRAVPFCEGDGFSGFGFLSAGAELVALGGEGGDFGT